MSLESKLKVRTRSAQAARNKVHFSALPLTSHCSTCRNCYKWIQWADDVDVQWCLTNLRIIKVFILFGEHSRELISPELCWLEFVGLVAAVQLSGGKRAPVFGAGDSGYRILDDLKELERAWKNLKGLERR